MGRRFQGILLDLDETLYSREEAFSSWLDAEARAAGLPAALDRAKVAALDQRGRGDRQGLLEYLDSVFEWRHQPHERAERFRLGIGAASRLAPGVKESLTRIAEQFKLGLITNGSTAMQRTKLRALNVETLFDPIVISEEVGFRKPDARIFELALAKWQASPATVLFVGDDPVSDIQGAKAAGLRALRVGHDDGIPSIVSLEAWLAADSE